MIKIHFLTTQLDWKYNKHLGLISWINSFCVYSNGQLKHKSPDNSDYQGFFNPNKWNNYVTFFGFTFNSLPLVSFNAVKKS